MPHVFPTKSQWLYFKLKLNVKHVVYLLLSWVILFCCRASGSPLCGTRSCASASSNDRHDDVVPHTFALSRCTLLQYIRCLLCHLIYRVWSTVNGDTFLWHRYVLAHNTWEFQWLHFETYDFQIPRTSKSLGEQVPKYARSVFWIL